MNQFFLVIGATLCYVGGFGVMIFLLGVLTELCIEIWDGKFKQICLRFQINPADVAYLAENRKDIETTSFLIPSETAFYSQFMVRIPPTPP